MSIQLIAHRGGTDQHPELTIASARHSLELGAAFAEIDVRFSRDGIPVISHDPDAKRLFGHSAYIDTMTAADYTALTYTSDNRYHPHTLQQFLEEEIAPLVLHIKQKDQPLPRILQLLRDFQYEDKTVIGVVSCNDVRVVKQFNPQLRVLAFMPDALHIEDFHQAGADIIRLWEPWVEQEAIRKIQSLGMQVWVMTGVSEETVGYTSAENLLTWRDMGVDGILINEVANALHVLA